jgi:hypothetical protein
MLSSGLFVVRVVEPADLAVETTHYTTTLLTTIMKFYQRHPTFWYADADADELFLEAFHMPTRIIV